MSNSLDTTINQNNTEKRDVALDKNGNVTVTQRALKAFEYVIGDWGTNDAIEFLTEIKNGTLKSKKVEKLLQLRKEHGFDD